MLRLSQFSLIFWFLNWNIYGFLPIIHNYRWNNPNLLDYQKRRRQLKCLYRRYTLTVPIAQVPYTAT
ncbi:unnamed protein product [Prunus brigantina]